MAYDSELRAIAGPEPEIVDGVFPLNDTPGLGVELNWDEIEPYRTHKLPAETDYHAQIKFVRQARS